MCLFYLFIGTSSPILSIGSNLLRVDHVLLALIWTGLVGRQSFTDASLSFFVVLFLVSGRVCKEPVDAVHL